MNKRAITNYLNRVSHVTLSLFLKVLLLFVFISTITAAKSLESGGIALQPLIYGDLDGVSVISQGNKAVYYIPPDQTLTGAHQAHNENSLLEVMVKNRTTIILLRNGSIRFLQSGEKKLDEPESSSSLPSSGQQFSHHQKEITLPIEITPAATYTGISVIDQTPALAWLNRETMSVLAESIKAHETYEITMSVYDSESELTSIEPTTTDEAYQHLLRMTGSADEHTSTIQLSAPTPHVQKQYWKGYEVSSGQDVFRLEPAPSLSILPAGSHTHSWKIRQAGTTDVSQATKTQSADSPSSTEQAVASSITEEASPSSTPVLSASRTTSEEGVQKETILLITENGYHGIGTLREFALQELKRRDPNISISEYQTEYWEHVIDNPRKHQVFAKLIKEYEDKGKLDDLFDPPDYIMKKDRGYWSTCIRVKEYPLEAYDEGFCKMVGYGDELEKVDPYWLDNYKAFLAEKEFFSGLRLFLFNDDMSSDRKIEMLKQLFPSESISREEVQRNFLSLIGHGDQDAKSCFETPQAKHQKKSSNNCD